jgi:hypothetical protein
VRVAKIRVEKMIRLEAERDPAEEPAIA